MNEELSKEDIVNRMIEHYLKNAADYGNKIPDAVKARKEALEALKVREKLEERAAKIHMEERYKVKKKLFMKFGRNRLLKRY